MQQYCRISRDRQGKPFCRYPAWNGLPALTLTTFRDLSFNEHFYQKLGYKTLDEAELPERLADILKTIFLRFVGTSSRAGNADSGT
jgi:hypothetical protein